MSTYLRTYPWIFFKGVSSCWGYDLHNSTCKHAYQHLMNGLEGHARGTSGLAILPSSPRRAVQEGGFTTSQIHRFVCRRPRPHHVNQFIDESGQSSPDWPVPATPASLTLSNPQGQLPRWPSAVSAPFQKILRGVWKCSHCSYMYVQVEVPYTNSRCDVTSTVLFCVISSLRMGVSESSADRWRRVLCFNARVTLTSFWLHTSSRESHHTVYHCTAS